MDNKDERNVQYYSHRPEPYGDPPQQSEFPSPSGVPIPTSFLPPPTVYIPPVLPPAQPPSFKPFLPQPYGYPPPGSERPRLLSPNHPQLTQYSPCGYPKPYGDPPQGSEHPRPLSPYHPQLSQYSPFGYPSPSFKPFLPQPYDDPPQGSERPRLLSPNHPQLSQYSPCGYPKPYGDPPQGSEHPRPLSPYHPQLSQYSPCGYPSPRRGRVLQTYISPPPPSIKPSRQLRASIENQTDVAMGITKHLLLTLGGKKNMVYSPLSIHVVLSMILAGTKGHMQDQMLSFLKSKSINEINDLACNVVPLVLANGSSKGGPRLSFANGVWVEKSIHVEPGFKLVLETTYKAALNQVDFVTRAEEVRCKVNSWAENETNGLIKELIPAGSVTSATILILANALYFKGSWKQKFDESMTIVDNFYFPNGRSVKAPFMSSWKSQFISVFDGFKVLKLPYEQGRDYERHFSMYVFLPNARNGLEAVVKRVCSASGFIDRHLPKSKVRSRILIPKFKISAGFDALEVLEHLGLRLKETGVTNIFHKAYMEVNEEGTESAAATAALVICGAAAEPPRIDFVADHPFLYLIREEVTGTVLFIGHVLNPITEEDI